MFFSYYFTLLAAGVICYYLLCLLCSTTFCLLCGTTLLCLLVALLKYFAIFALKVKKIDLAALFVVTRMLFHF